MEEHPEVCYAESGKRWHYRSGEKLLYPGKENMNRICGREEALSLYIDNRLFHWSVNDAMFRRKAIGDHRFNTGYAEEMHFHIFLFDENDFFFASDDPETPKYNYNKTMTDNLMSKPFNPNHYAQLIFFLEFEELANKHGYSSLSDKSFAEVCKRRLSYPSKALIFTHPNLKKHFNEWKTDARSDFKKAMHCKHLGSAIKADYALFCAFPHLMRRINNLLLSNK